MTGQPVWSLFKTWARIRSVRISGANNHRRARRVKATSNWTKCALIEQLERRELLSAAGVLSTMYAEPSYQLEKPATTAAPSGLSPSQILTAYGFNQLSFHNGSNGTGQIIAIVDAYNDPTIKTDLQAFDNAYGLPSPPNLMVMSQTGSTTALPSTDPSKDWELEESLDVEWAHALAPGASIVLVEASSAGYSDLITAVQTAAALPSVSVVSMSWGGGEFAMESMYDSFFTTPAGHEGVTFLASTGDDGAPGGFPAYSSNVVAVGGTHLSVGSSGNYISESGWSGSGGGISSYESQPAYQKGVVTQSTTKRTIPDVSFDADPNSGVAVYDSFTNGASNPWITVGGTSFSAPAWGAIVSIANQARAQNGLGTLNGATQTLSMLYQLDKSNPSAFHDITSGNNGNSASTGYDLVTGLGSPDVNVLVPGLAGSTSVSTVSKLVFQQLPASGTAGAKLGGFTVAVEDQNGNVVASDSSTVTLSIASGPAGFATGSTISVKAINGIATFSNLILDGAGSYTLKSTDGSLAATSGVTTINAAAAAKLVFLQTPTTATTGTALGTVKVAIEDQYGNIVTSNHSNVTISIASGGGKFAANSTLTVMAVNGVATFNNLIVTTWGTYRLGASDGSLTNATTTNNLAVTAALTAPQKATLTPLSPTSALLAWTAASNDDGYRIYKVNGSQSTLIASASATATSYQITGLTAGSTVSFKVEAYQGTSVADSQVATATTPLQTLTAPKLTAIDLSSSLVLLTWSGTASPDGYRIYIASGTSRILMGTLGPNATSVTVVGLKASTSYQFQVEAYRGTTVADSAWATVKTATVSLHQAVANLFDFWDGWLD